MSRKISSATFMSASLIAALVLWPFGSASAVNDKPMEIIAIQIRKQGFACNKPSNAERDLKSSKPNETVWVLKCENAVDRVRLIPGRAADVKRTN